MARMKTFYKYADQKGRVIFATSHVTAERYINNQDDIDTAYYCGEFLLSPGQIRDGDYEKIKNGIYRRVAW